VNCRHYSDGRACGEQAIGDYMYCARHLAEVRAASGHAAVNPNSFGPKPDAMKEWFAASPWRVVLFVAALTLLSVAFIVWPEAFASGRRFTPRSVRVIGLVFTPVFAWTALRAAVRARRGQH
jgi:hypothetical protein